MWCYCGWGLIPVPTPSVKNRGIWMVLLDLKIFQCKIAAGLCKEKTIERIESTQHYQSGYFRARTGSMPWENVWVLQKVWALNRKQSYADMMLWNLQSYSNQFHHQANDLYQSNEKIVYELISKLANSADSLQPSAVAVLFRWNLSRCYVLRQIINLSEPHSKNGPVLPFNFVKVQPDVWLCVFCVWYCLLAKLAFS